MKCLLLVGLLLLPHHAQAQGASIPLVLTFNEGVTHTAPSGGPVYQPITPIVMHVVLTLDGVVEVTTNTQPPLPGNSVRGIVRGLVFDGVTFPQFPTPDNLGRPFPSSGLAGSASEQRSASWCVWWTCDAPPGHQQAFAGWGQQFEFYGGQEEGWTNSMSLRLSSQSRDLFPNNAPIGTPTVQSVLDTLAWGGTMTMYSGWFYNVGELTTQENAQFLRGTYALDTTAPADSTPPADSTGVGSPCVLICPEWTKP